MNLKKLIKSTFYLLNKNKISQLKYTRDIKNRANLKVTDLELLAKPIGMFAPYTSEIHPPNDWYGHAANLKAYLGLPKEYQFKFILEHGLYLNDQVDLIDIETNLPSIITYSNKRAMILRKYRKYTFAIGPFIHYARTLLSEEKIRDEKKRLGKSLLMFPAHSSSMIGFEYDIPKLCKKLKKLAKNIDNIRICLYWKDILQGKHKIYQDFGFECVTAGHMLDPLFLPRLKSIIEISDLTASNIASAHVGYCIYLGKPHIILLDKLNLQTSNEWKERIDQVFESKGYNEIIDEFSKFNFKISLKQKKLIDKYWGTSNIKTKDQLRKIIDRTEEIYSLR